MVTAELEGQSKVPALQENSLDLLDPAIFWRAHRGFVVNINHIRESGAVVQSSYRRDDKEQTGIPVSRSQTRRLRELFNLSAGMTSGSEAQTFHQEDWNQRRCAPGDSGELPCQNGCINMTGQDCGT